AVNTSMQARLRHLTAMDGEMQERFPALPETVHQGKTGGTASGICGIFEGEQAMFIKKKHLSRRTLLRGAGAALSLPLLDAMIPALTAQAQTAANIQPRLGFVYVPHGAIMSEFTPDTTGRDFAFKPILQSLEPYRDRLNIISGLAHQAADTTAVHSLSPCTWLSGVRPKATLGSDAYAGITADQF